MNPAVQGVYVWAGLVTLSAYAVMLADMLLLRPGQTYRQRFARAGRHRR